MRGALTRSGLALVMGVILAAGIVGVAIDLAGARSRSRADAERSATERPALAGALIDSLLGGSSSNQLAAERPVSHWIVTRQQVRAVMGTTPLGAVLSADGRLLASSSPLSVSTRAEITGDPSVHQVLSGQHMALSNLLPAHGSMPAGFLSATGFPTAFGRRVQVAWFPLPTLTAALQHYLSYIAHYTSARVYLIDATGTVIGSSSLSDRVGGPVADPALRVTLAHGSVRGHLHDGSAFFSVAGLRVAPWRVVYTVPAGVLYGSTGYSPLLPFLLLAGFAVAAGVCLILLLRLSLRSQQLAKANVAYAQRNAEVEQANQAKTRFLANMSHELRTPLNAIIGFAELLDDERLGPVPDEHHEFLGDIRSSAQHLLHLINEMLDVSRIESGRIMLDVQEIEPLQIAGECIDSVRALASETGITVELDGEPMGAVLLDPARLRQVLLNYLSNALKFTPPGGSIIVRLVDSHGQLLIEVIDTGLGIDPADQRRVFDEFEQLSNRPQGGTGLGLAVTKRIVEAQRGTVGVRSTPGRGSTFYARLPMRRQDRSGANRVQAESMLMGDTGGAR